MVSKQRYQKGKTSSFCYEILDYSAMMSEITVYFVTLRNIVWFKLDKHYEQSHLYHIFDILCVLHVYIGITFVCLPFLLILAKKPSLFVLASSNIIRQTGTVLSALQEQPGATVAFLRKLASKNAQKMPHVPRNYPEFCNKKY